MLDPVAPALPVIRRLGAAIDRGVAALMARRDSNGLWRDFRTEAGESDEWVSGFVAWALAECDGVDLSPTLHTLRLRQRRNGGWGYNRGIPADADSTGWVLAAMGRSTCLPSAIERAVRFLKVHQSADDGGFSTYTEDDGIRDIIGMPERAPMRGWLESQPCVTAVASWGLLTHREPRHSFSLQSGATYLAKRQNNNGLWASYWWSSETYGGYLSLRALSCLRRLSRTEAQSAINALTRLQSADGAWREGPGRTDAFSTAFGMLALLLFPDPQTIDAAARGAAWLLDRQHADGRWPGEPILRIPAPVTGSPEGMSRQSWRVMERGTDVIVADQNGLYTTAAAVRALKVFRATRGT